MTIRYFQWWETVPAQSQMPLKYIHRQAHLYLASSPDRALWDPSRVQQRLLGGRKIKHVPLRLSSGYESAEWCYYSEGKISALYYCTQVCGRKLNACLICRLTGKWRYFRMRRWKNSDFALFLVYFGCPKLVMILFQTNNTSVLNAKKCSISEVVTPASNTASHWSTSH